VEGGHRVTPSDRPLIECRDLQLSRGGRRLLRGVTFEMQRGEAVALMGASGAGKTTILRAIAGLDPIDRGEIAVGGVRVSGGAGQDFRQLRAKSAMVFQFHCLFEHLSVAQNVWLAPVHVQKVPRAEAVQRATMLLRSLGVEHRAAALPRELSGGEAQRVAIARALAVDAPVLLMDEPTASLDPERRAELAALVRSLVVRDRALIVATHDEEFARAVATRILRVREGLVSEAGTGGQALVASD
jgi:ABC-type polar amino acid transport system ATPase subunit